LYVLHVVERPAQWVRAWKPEVPGIHEVFHARFVGHAYPEHTHDAWTVFTVDERSIAYDLERRHRGVERSKVTLLPPAVDEPDVFNRSLVRGFGSRISPSRTPATSSSSPRNSSVRPD
jgi:hypothetical protein